jgi:oligopeptide transport system substrate-binding protein
VRLEVIYHMPAEDLDTGFRQYRAGEIDILTVIPPNRLDWARENLPGELHLTPIIGLDYYVFNVNRAPFSDVRVRRALSMAVNREIITQRITKGGEPPAYSLMPPDILNYPNAPQADFKDWDNGKRIASAKALLAEAGFGPGNPLKFTLRYNTNEQHKRVAVAASSMWKQLGVQVSLANSEAKVLVSDIRSGDFEVARASWFGEVRDAMTYLELLHSDSGPINRSGFNNAQFDRFVDTARQTIDVAERAEWMRKAEQIALYKQPIMPLNFYVSKRLIKPYVRGFEDNSRGIHLARYFSVER